MRINFKKSVILSIAIAALLGSNFISSVSGGVDNNEKEQNILQINVGNNEDRINIDCSLSDFKIESVKINNKVFSNLILDGESKLYQKGFPDLPIICGSVIIPDKSIMGVKVTNSNYEEIDNINIVPSKGHILRSIDTKDVPYSFDDIYNKDIWYPEKIVDLSESYYIRDYKGQVVRFYPFQYNPLQQKLRYYKEISVEIYPIGIDNNAILNSRPKYIDTDFITIYKNHFTNFVSISYEPLEEQGNMLVITYDDFWNQMVPFVQWKNMKGIPTEMVKVSEIGGANDIKNYIKDYYDNNGLTFVLLVGDVQQVPTLYSAGGASDVSYSYVVGTDHYPDLFIGRFSAQNAAQVETQVERTLEYEQNPQIAADWYHMGTGIGSSEGPGDDGEYDFEHIRNIRTDLLNYYYTEVDELYDGSQGGDDAPGNPTPTMVSNVVNEGRGIINYCGHGWAEGWGTTYFSNDEVNSLINDNKLPFIWSVACNNGEFDNYPTCFAEAWMRATHNGEPTGAIATFMSSISQYWDPPMAAQDEFNDLLVESYQENIKNTFGGISFSGCMLMNDEFGSYGSDMTDTWHVFGDPSLQVRTDIPSDITVNYDSQVPMGTLIYELDVPGVENALCAISKDYITLGYALTDETGHAIIEFEDPIPYGGDLSLVVTAYNRVPFISTIAVDGDDNAPEKPDKPTGKKLGKPWQEYTYSSSTTDPDNDDIKYMWDWGDGNFSDWIGPYTSGEECEITYIWSQKGSYSVKVKAKDIYGMESEWSDPLIVTMPVKYSIISFFENNFPIIYKLILALFQIIK